MPFVDRDEQGKILSMYACSQFVGQEYIDDSHQDILDFEAGLLAIVTARTAEREDLRSQVQDETEEIWLARTDNARWKIVLKLLKAIEKRI